MCGVKFAYVSVDYVFVLCLMVLANCLLNAFAICLCVAVLLLKEIVLL